MHVAFLIKLFAYLLLFWQEEAEKAKTLESPANRWILTPTVYRSFSNNKRAVQPKAQPHLLIQLIKSMPPKKTKEYPPCSRHSPTTKTVVILFRETLQVHNTYISGEKHCLLTISIVRLYPWMTTFNLLQWAKES